MEFESFLGRMPSKPWKKVIRYLRYNGNIVPKGVVQVPKYGTYKNGLIFEKIEDHYQFTSNTICQCYVEENFKFSLNADGTLLEGDVNCFGLGFRGIDKEYVQELLEEYNTKDDSWFAWDVIEYDE